MTDPQPLSLFDAPVEEPGMNAADDPWIGAAAASRPGTNAADDPGIGAAAASRPGTDAVDDPGIPVRALLEPAPEARFPLPPGDRPMVVPGTIVAAGDPLLDHLRDRRIEEIGLPAGDPDRPLAGSRWVPVAGRRHREAGPEGELLVPVPGKDRRWRIVTGDHRTPLRSPVAGVVTEVRPGAEVRVRPDGRALRAAFAAGSAARGRLELATDPFGELRPGGIDVGRAGSILVVGSRIDAEALTRARAMGVAGIVVASLPGKELRDFQASERRQRAALHPVPPFGVLVLEGAVRRSIPAPVVALLEAAAGLEVALLVDPPMLVIDAPGLALPAVDPAWVRVRSGPNAGCEGRLVGPAGLRRFAGGVHLEAAFVLLGDEAPVAIPLGDLERLA